MNEEDNGLISEWRFAGRTHRDWGCEELEPLRTRIRAYYREHQRGICAYCANEVSVTSANNANIEHILPKSTYECFIFETRNMCIICADCNQAKGNTLVDDGEDSILNGRAIRYPSASNRFKIVHPFIDEYSDHIVKRRLAYIGITKKGLSTIATCDLNRFVRKFGYENSFLDDFELANLLNKFACGSKQEKREVFEHIRQLIP
ncbi:HNH endonuclease [Pseudomonas sp. DP-17]|uniref:HNH endonuclease n=1 Tax=Pseudomonas sp. DP-17 TaxID=1580486 RepID=UPI001EFACE8A|nr:HNH endonuclease [Pseudomonas sp. DP-17]MCG8911311.1 HNH endonuclease [Pseudomonas sp. DP-17]